MKVPCLLLAGRRSDLGELIEMFVQEMPERINALETQARSRDWQQLTRTAHQLKGAAGSYGFNVITPSAARLESATKDGRQEEEILAALDELLDLCRRMRSGAPPTEDEPCSSMRSEFPESEEAVMSRGHEQRELDPSDPPLRFDLLCRRVLDDREMALELLDAAAGRLDQDLADMRRPSTAVNECCQRPCPQAQGHSRQLVGRAPCVGLAADSRVAAAAEQIESLGPCFSQVELAASASDRRPVPVGIAVSRGDSRYGP